MINQSSLYTIIRPDHPLLVFSMSFSEKSITTSIFAPKNHDLPLSLFQQRRNRGGSNCFSSGVFYCLVSHPCDLAAPRTSRNGQTLNSNSAAFFPAYGVWVGMGSNPWRIPMGRTVYLYTYFWLIFMVHVGKHIPYMDRKKDTSPGPMWPMLEVFESMHVTGRVVQVVATWWQ